MADAFGVKDVDGIFDLFGAAGFASVGEKMKAMFGGIGVRGMEFGQRNGKFVAAQAECDDAFVAEIRGHAGDLHGRCRAELADGVKDELDLRTGPRLGAVVENVAECCEICGHVLFAEKHDSGRESKLGVNDALLVERCRGVFCEEGVVFRLAQEGGGPFVELEKLCEVAGAVAGVDFVPIDGDRIFLRE